MRNRLCSFFIGLLGLLLFAAPMIAADEGNGRADLDRAIDANISAATAPEFGKVIDLCHSALDKGLDRAGEEFCKQLLVTTLLNRAAMRGGLRSDDLQEQAQPSAADLRAAIKDTCELTSYRQAHILSTLAAAYAEIGDFDAARSWSQRSLQIADESLQNQVRKELACYEKNEPYRSLPADAEPAAND